MRRAYNYFNQLHAFARDMLLGHGTDLTDYDIASRRYQIRHGPDHGKHQARRRARTPQLESEIEVGCRSGRSTADIHIRTISAQ